jgi:diguanylate cyclase (GGDEF)-like protein
MPLSLLPEAQAWKPAIIRIIAISFLSAVLIASGIESWISYRNAIEKTAERTQTTSFLIAEWLSASFAITKHIIKDIISDLDPAEIHYPSDDPVRHTQRTDELIRHAKMDPTILFLGLFDAQCTVTHTSVGFNLGKTFKERDYCRLVFEEPIEAFKAGPMFVASNNKRNVTISYPVLGPSREIAGFVLIGLDLSFFQHWLDRLQPRDGLVVSIFDMKQQLLARLPMAPNMIGKSMDAPVLRRFSASPDTGPFTFRDTSLVDGIDRVWNLHRVRDLPFVVVTGLPTQEALGVWWTTLFYYSLGNLMLAAVLLFGVREFNRSHRLAQSMAEMAGTDSLTGLANRRRFMETAGFRLAEACRYQWPFAVIIMDLDHFKQINDRFGHDAGDAMLRAFAAILQRAARANDCMARWGGEEFIALLPNANEQMAAKFAERLRTLAAEITVIPNAHATISIGVSEYRGPETLEALIKRADAALYRAKQQGRDQVQIAP